MKFRTKSLRTQLSPVTRVMHEFSTLQLIEHRRVSHTIRATCQPINFQAARSSGARRLARKSRATSFLARTLDVRSSIDTERTQTRRHAVALQQQRKSLDSIIPGDRTGMTPVFHVDETLALISIVLLGHGSTIYDDDRPDRWAGQPNGNGAVPRTGSLDRKRHESTGASLIACRKLGQIKTIADRLRGLHLITPSLLYAWIALGFSYFKRFSQFEEMNLKVSRTHRALLFLIS